MKAPTGPSPKLEGANSIRPESPPLEDVLEKHKKYKCMYGKNEIYWGLGIECESYLELSKPVFVQPGFMINNHQRERYSVDYYTSYKKETLAQGLSQFQKVKEEIPLPVLVNSHAITKMDGNLEHQTLYKQGSPSNPKFSGKTIFDLLKEIRPEFFEKEYEKTFIFDGDSIEIMTQNFYKTTIEKTVEELRSMRREFIEQLRACLCDLKQLTMYCDIDWMSGNHGFAVMVTNPKNLAIFNNGTYHINITLPTLLDSDGKIADFKIFENQHRNYIQYIQWMEPLFIANFGSPDPLSWLVENQYSLGSQRCAMSRYIGLGTYDTRTMKRGKLLTVDVSEVRSSWYKKYHQNSGYNALEKVGLDINFNKHWNHGIEIRFFDWFPEERLSGVLKFLVYLGDISLEKPCLAEAVVHPIWNEWMARVIQKGNEAGCSEKEASILSQILGIPCSVTESLEILFANLYSSLSKRVPRGSELCSKYFLDEKVTAMRAVEVVEPPKSAWKCC
jgi:hypothetical protein